ncbi:phosphoribosyltransferase [Patescibacteria group bacterium]|nr:phosphoribosyltransferase [Patescibacteria group bacterium]
MAKKKTQKPVIIVDVAVEDYKKLSEFGFVHISDHSWAKESRNNNGFLLLLKKCDVNVQGQERIHEVVISVTRPVDNLESYFEYFATELQRDASKILAKTSEPPIFILNLMPFYLSITRMDRILKALFLGKLNIRDGLILLMVRNLDWVLKSSVFQDICTQQKLPLSFFVVDLRCYAKRFHKNQFSDFEIPQGTFQYLLDINKTRIYNSLVFGTNSHIGHYELANSHVRTHYDLREFIARDNVWEYLHKFFLSLVDEAETVLFIGTGIERDVIIRVGYQLQTLFGQRYVVTFEYLPPLTAAENIDTTLSRQNDAVIVFTDIVNSGNTLQPLVQKLVANNSEHKPIHIFTIAKMRNSPSEIEGIKLNAGLTIKRDYYTKRPDSCKLCQLGQPPVKVKEAEDFRQVLPGQLTPYDFWEIVTDSQALLRKQKDPQGRFFSFRIDTHRVVRRYGHWLRNVIAQRFAETWPNTRPEVICTVEEETGLTFASLVSEAIDVNKIVSIPRRDLRRVTPGGGLPQNTKNPFDGVSRVLLADDGINFGNTMSNLIMFCRAAGINPMGAIVLDSRLDQRATDGIRVQMSRSPLVALYEWPTRSSHL